MNLIHRFRSLRLFQFIVVFLSMSVSTACSAGLTAPTTESIPIIPVTGLATTTALPPATDPTLNRAPTPVAAAITNTPVVACQAPVGLTPAVTEGPYFKANSPERASLIDANTQGMRLTLTGYVLTTDCKPVANALLDFWQADSLGQYDNAGYTLRGHQFTDANGHYQLETIVPGLYPGRTEHIHVKVQAPGGPILTTQLFFPGVTDNESDEIYTPALLINVLNNAGSMQATFNFIIDLK